MTADTNPRPCGKCGTTCGYLGPDGNGYYQCAVYGSLWADDDPISATFVARLLGMSSVDTVLKWQARGVMPPPSWTTDETGRPMWRRRTILDWAKATGRL